MSLADTLQHAVRKGYVAGAYSVAQRAGEPEQLIWHGDPADEPTPAQIDAWGAERQAEAAATAYKAARRAEYPSPGDQLDQLWKWAIAGGLMPDTSAARDINTPQGMAGEIEAVKARHPKP